MSPRNPIIGFGEVNKAAVQGHPIDKGKLKCSLKNNSIVLNMVVCPKARLPRSTHGSRVTLKASSQDLAKQASDRMHQGDTPVIVWVGSITPLINRHEQHMRQP